MQPDPEMVGGGKGTVATTDYELDQVLKAAQEFAKGFTIVEVPLDPRDSSRVAAAD